MKSPLPPMKEPSRRTRTLDSSTDAAAKDDFVARAADHEAVVIPKPAPAPPKEETRRLTLDLPVSLHRKFKKKAIDNDMTMMEFLIRAVDQWTRENG